MSTTVPVFLVVAASYLVQAGLAVLLAAVLVGFHRVYRRAYLAAWAVSWLALAVHGAGGAMGLVGVVRGLPPGEPMRIVATVLYLLGGFAQVGGLLAGVAEIRSGRRLARATLLRWSFAIALASVVLALLPLDDPHGRALLRVGLRQLIAGVAFLVAGRVVFTLARARALPRRQLGAWMVGGSFAAYGLGQLYLFAVQGLAWLRLPIGTATTWFGLIEVLLEAAMGLGMVIWLYEEEHERLLAASQQIDRLALRDPLTGLANRRALLEQIALAQQAESRGDIQVVVACFDVDQFQALNDSYGFAVADEVLRQLAERLRGLAAEALCVARIGGDELAVLLAAVPAAGIEAQVAELRRGLVAPLAVGGRELAVTVAAGFAAAPAAAFAGPSLLEHAITAMHRAKQLPRQQIAVYQPEMSEHAAARLELAAELRRALAGDELEVWYQPIIPLRRGELASFEALVRWRHPLRGPLGPATFMRQVEGSPLGDAIDDLVLERACRQALSWRTERPTRISVNVSAGRFQSPHLVAEVERVLRETGLPPHALELEITETVAMQDPAASREVLVALRELGVRLAIDDFGTGHSSLAYLRRLPVDAVKLDRSFVVELERNDDDVAIVGALVELAHGLALRVVAEGVETPGQLAMLVDLGCDAVQGYLFAHPLPADQLGSLTDWRRRQVDLIGLARRRRAG